MTDYIRKAVELADGWQLHTGQENASDYVLPDGIETLAGYRGTVDGGGEILDALAAQLVRQVDAIDGFWADSDNYGTAKVWIGDLNGPKSRIAKSNDEDRTMNTIRAIVDSGVLSG